MLLVDEGKRVESEFRTRKISCSNIHKSTAKFSIFRLLCKRVGGVNKIRRRMVKFMRGRSSGGARSSSTSSPNSIQIHFYRILLSWAMWSCSTSVWYEEDSRVASSKCMRKEKIELIRINRISMIFLIIEFALNSTRICEENVEVCIANFFPETFRNLSI